MTIDKIFRDFLDDATVSNLGLNEALSYLQSIIKPIAEELFIGYIELSISAPPSTVRPGGEKGTEILYKADDYSELDTEKYGYSTPEKGNFTVSLRPIRGHKWDSVERDGLKSLSDVLYIACGRARLSSMMMDVMQTDIRTGLRNVAGLEERGRTLFIKGELGNYVCIWMNIRNYRVFNQREGSQCADKGIVEYAHLLLSFMQDEDCIVSPGGDNFIALVHRRNVEEFLKNIRNTEIYVEKNGVKLPFRIDAWAGYYYINPGDSINMAMQKSSIAMATAKSRRTAQLHYPYEEYMMEEQVKQREISSIFRQAISDRRFVVYYQPKVELENAQMCGAEALVRWNRDGRIVMPTLFIPTLEREGSICELDFYVLEDVCRSIRRWIDQGIEPVRISTNFSKEHFKNMNTAGKILEILNKYDIDGKYIQIEVTEMSGYMNSEGLLEFMQKLHEHGVTIAIDDFGTGYSSLNLLKDYTADIVKIDKSFLNDVDTSEKARKLLGYIVSLSQAIGMDVIVEGVETKEQVEYVKSLGCNQIQGFYFDKPMDSDKFIECLPKKQYEIK